MPTDPRARAFTRNFVAAPFAVLLLASSFYVALNPARHLIEHGTSAAVSIADDDPAMVAMVKAQTPPPPNVTPPTDHPLASATVAAPAEPAPAEAARTPAVTVEKSEQLAMLFDAHDYRLEDVKTGEKPVPALTVAKLPQDLGQITEVDLRKRLFIKTLLPLVLQVNQRILEDRNRILGLRADLTHGHALTAADRDWLDDMYDRYDVDDEDMDTLLQRVDIVPPSLAVAQAITESGWGTSYSARVGNALFGQFHISARGRKTTVGATQPGSFQMRAFDSLTDAVSAYVHNLNTHMAYRTFRELRAKQRTAGDGIDGYALANTLVRYSELGMRYVQVVKLIMRTEDLTSLDDARLQQL